MTAELGMTRAGLALGALALLGACSFGGGDGDGDRSRARATDWPSTGQQQNPDPPRRDRDANPPGAKGGPGTNWENPPGPEGGEGKSPDRF